MKGNLTMKNIFSHVSNLESCCDIFSNFLSCLLFYPYEHVCTETGVYISLNSHTFYFMSKIEINNLLKCGDCLDSRTLSVLKKLSVVINSLK